MLISFGIASRCGDTLSRGFGPIPLEALTKAIEDRGGKGAVEIQAVDYGPGFIDVAAALKDHYSTGGTLRLVCRVQHRSWILSRSSPNPAGALL